MAMAEEINYASVVFKTNKRPQVQDEERIVYDEVKSSNETAKPIPLRNGSGALSSNDEVEMKFRCYERLVCLFGILCCCLLLGIVGVCIYLASQQEGAAREASQLKTSNKLLTDDIHNLTNLYDNLLQSSNDLNIQINNVSAENRNLTMRNEDLQMQNMELRNENQNLAEQIENMETQWSKLNVSRAQWSINAYCPKHSDNDERKCAPCQDGWLNSWPSCYAINNADNSKQKTWEEARQDCREKNSDLVVVADENEKSYVSKESWPNGSPHQSYWIGLRYEDGRWKWVNGSYLMISAWIPEGTGGHCAVSIKDEHWKSMRCDQKHRWICKKEAILL